MESTLARTDLSGFVVMLLREYLIGFIGILIKLQETLWREAGSWLFKPITKRQRER